jgi:hypothetical protein
MAKRGEADYVEGADQVDLDHLGEHAEVVRAVLGDGTGGAADAGAVHRDPRSAELLDHGLDRGLGAGGIRHVGLDEDSADLPGLLLAELFLQIEDRDLGACRRQRRRRGAAQSRCAAGDDGGLPLDVHSVLLGCAAFSMPPPLAKRRRALTSWA